MFFFLRKQILKVTELIMIGNGTIFHISEMLPELFNSLSVFNSSNIHISFNFAFSCCYFNMTCKSPFIRNKVCKSLILEENFIYYNRDTTIIEGFYPHSREV